MASDDLLLGVGQAQFWAGKREKNFDQIRRLLDEAGRLGVDILALPELANSGYSLRDVEEAESCSEQAPEGMVCDLLRAWSRSSRMVICGLCENYGERLYNSAVVFSNGEHQGTYRKAHLFMKESQIFSPGEEEPPVFEFRGARLGVMICYDWAFPEMARVLALKGAQAILHPSNLVLPYGQQAMIIRSIENHVFTATANRFGDDRGIPFSGCSQITSPKGEILAKSGPTDTGVIAARVNLSQADQKMITPYNDVLKDRKPEIYGRITKRGSTK